MTQTPGHSDVERFTRLYDAYYVDVFRYAARRVGRTDAQDVVADVFTTAWRHLTDVPEPPLPWLYRAAWHTIGNKRRAAQRGHALLRRLGHEAATDASIRDPADQAAEVDAAIKALRRLPPLDQESVRLICWEQLSLADAAVALNCSEAALKVRLHRARRRLASLLAQHDGSTKDDPVLTIQETTP